MTSKTRLLSIFARNIEQNAKPKTDTITEGQQNLFFTAARASAASATAIAQAQTTKLHNTFIKAFI